MTIDVPSPIDLRSMKDARPWAEAALGKRPVRPEFFDMFARLIGVDGARVLELGSGPGFLADHLLRAWPGLRYVALDFSPAMHQLAAERLGERAARVAFIERSFREPAWSDGLGPFDFIVTHQAALLEGAADEFVWMEFGKIVARTREFRTPESMGESRR